MKEMTIEEVKQKLIDKANELEMEQQEIFRIYENDDLTHNSWYLRNKWAYSECMVLLELIGRGCDIRPRYAKFVNKLQLDQVISDEEQIADQKLAESGFETDNNSYQMSQDERQTLKTEAEKYQRITDWLKELRWYREKRYAMPTDNIVDGLHFTIDMFLFDPGTGEILTDDRLNDLDLTTVLACRGAIEKLQDLELELAKAKAELAEYKKMYDNVKTDTTAKCFQAMAIVSGEFGNELSPEQESYNDGLRKAVEIIRSHPFTVLPENCE